MAKKEQPEATAPAEEPQTEDTKPMSGKAMKLLARLNEYYEARKLVDEKRKFLKEHYGLTQQGLDNLYEEFLEEQEEGGE